MARPKTEKRANGGANLGFEQTAWLTTNNSRVDMNASKHKHTLLSLISESRTLVALLPKPLSGAVGVKEAAHA